MTISGAPQQVCGVVLLRADGAALLQLRDEKPEISDPGLWVFPGGHCEPGETRDAGALREFFEETCYRCARLHRLATYSATELGYPGDFDLTFYWERFDGTQHYQCCEGQQLRFVARSEAPGLPIPLYLARVWDMAIAAAAAANMKEADEL
jgi:8-oxo-dGTP pyrophosphatase MutT (NUDIX family)